MVYDQHGGIGAPIDPLAPSRPSQNVNTPQAPFQRDPPPPGLPTPLLLPERKSTKTF